MSTPKDLFILAKYDVIIDRYIHNWRHGNIEWFDMLNKLAEELERKINEIVDENKIRDLFDKNVISSAPTPVLDYSLIPELLKINNKLEQQQLLISAILRIHIMQKIVFDIVVDHWVI